MSSVDSNVNFFVETAIRFLGVKEGTPQHNIILALYNSGRPLGEHEMGKDDPWCAAFVGAISSACGLGDIIPISASCERMINKFIAMGCDIVSKAERGDIAFFDWNGDGSYNDHVGIVTIAEPGHVRTIEGNHNDSVSYRDFSGGPVIFFRPKWTSSVQSTGTSTKYREYYSELSWDEKCEIKTFPLIKLGSKGIYVKVLQDFLGLDTDGTAGAETIGQLIEYQKSKNLEADGECGRQTWSSFFA